MKKYGSKCNISTLALIFVIIGALNWLLIGLFNWNLVDILFGNTQWLERLIYIVVGLSGIAMLVQCPCKTCNHGSCDTKEMKCDSCDTQDCDCAPDENEIEDMEKEEIKELEQELASEEK